MMFLDHDRGHRHATLLALHCGIEMILDCVVRATGHMLRHLGPLRAHPAVEFEDSHVFLVCEGRFVDYNRENGI
jgi:hypothetical protein